MEVERWEYVSVARINLCRGRCGKWKVKGGSRREGGGLTSEVSGGGWKWKGVDFGSERRKGWSAKGYLGRGRVNLRDGWRKVCVGRGDEMGNDGGGLMQKYQKGR